LLPPADHQRHPLHMPFRLPQKARIVHGVSLWRHVFLNGADFYLADINHWDCASNRDGSAVSTSSSGGDCVVHGTSTTRVMLVPLTNPTHSRSHTWRLFRHRHKLRRHITRHLQPGPSHRSHLHRPCHLGPRSHDPVDLGTSKGRLGQCGCRSFRDQAAV
jgi:hypothetical protein